MLNTKIMRLRDGYITDIFTDNNFISNEKVSTIRVTTTNFVMEYKIHSVNKTLEDEYPIKYKDLIDEFLSKENIIKNKTQHEFAIWFRDNMHNISSKYCDFSKDYDNFVLRDLISGIEIEIRC